MTDFYLLIFACLEKTYVHPPQLKKENVCIIVNWLLQVPAPQELHICQGTPTELSAMSVG